MPLVSPERAPEDARVRFLRVVLRSGVNLARDNSDEADARPLTVAQAAELSGLSRAAADQYSKRLRDAGMALPGRVEIEPRSGYVLGIDVRDTHPVRVALCNVQGLNVRPIWPTQDELSAIDDHQGPATANARQLLDRASQGVRECVEQSGIEPEKLIGIGISLQGAVVGPLVQGTGTVGSPWEHIRADRRLTMRLRKWAPSLRESMVVTRSDTHASAVAERLWGAPEAAVPHMIYVKWSVELRAAITLNGAMYNGHKGRAGELGHIVVEGDGKPPNIVPYPCGVCGQSSCLHALASLAYLSRIATKDRANAPLLSAEEIATCAKENDELMTALRVAARGIGIAVSSYVAALNPQTVVLGGAVGARVWDAVEEEFKQPIGESDPANAVGMDIVGARMERNTSTLGAAACALLERGPIYFRPFIGA